MKKDEHLLAHLLSIKNPKKEDEKSINNQKEKQKNPK
jgi:hypothetical protein